MKINIKSNVIRELIAEEGKVITDVATETDRAKIVALGCNDKIENYKEIDENTLLPEYDDISKEIMLKARAYDIITGGAE